MGIRKIVYVTNGEWDRNVITSAARNQLKAVADEVLEGNLEGYTKVFRSTKCSINRVLDTLIYFQDNVKKVNCDTAENIYSNYIKDLANTEEIIKSVVWGDIAVVLVTQQELKYVLGKLKRDGFDVINKDKIDHRTNIYAVSIDPTNTSESEFFEAHWGQQ